MDMTDKFVFIYRGDDGNIFNAGIIVGHSFDEVDKRAREIEAKQGGHYEISNDKTLAEVVYHFQNKEDKRFMADKEDWEELQNTIEDAEDYLKTVKEAVENYINELKNKSLDN
jgi:3-deoxy-D-manno-octulosonic-acid transferase